MKKFRYTIFVLFGLFLIVSYFYIFFIYQNHIHSLKKLIHNEYQEVYIENKKLQLKNIIKQIFYKIEYEKEKLRIKIKSRLSKKKDIVLTSINNQDKKKKKEIIIKTVSKLNKIFSADKIKIFIIDNNGNFIFNPEIGIFSKDLLNLIKGKNKNSNFLISYFYLKSQKFFIGTIGKYSEFEKELKKDIINYLNNFRYELNKTSDIFVLKLIEKNNNIKVIRLVNPNRPQEIPIDTKFLKKMVQKCIKNGEGYISYKWKIPETEKIGEKIIYVRYLKDWNWIIGTEFYLDIFKEELNKRDKNLNYIVKKYSDKFALNLIILHSFLFLILIFLVFKLTKNLDKYINKIKENEKFKETLINLIPNPIFVIDVNGNFIDINKSFENFFGIDKSQLFQINKNNNINKFFEIIILKKLMQADMVLEKSQKLNGKNRIITELDLKGNLKNFRKVHIYKSFFYKNNQLAGLIGVIFDVTEQKILTEKLYKQTIIDELTGAFNRRYFNQIFPIEKERAIRNNYKLSLIMFDIDFFKKINDTYGHQTGDNVLKELTKLINKNIRKYDYLFRIGGEEFVILVINADIKVAYLRAEKLRKIVEKHQFDPRFKITISLGVTEVKNNDKLSDAIKRADEALYMAKNSGRNKTVTI